MQGIKVTGIEGVVGCCMCQLLPLNENTDFMRGLKLVKPLYSYLVIASPHGLQCPSLL